MRRALLAMFTLACGGDLDCEPVSCPDDGVTVVFDTAAWDAGAWTITLTAGEDTFTCNLNLPVADLDAALCGEGRVTITLVDGVPTQAFWASEAPAEVGVRVALAEDVRFDDAVPVEEVKTFPGGPGCPPTCFESRATAAW